MSGGRREEVFEERVERHASLLERIAEDLERKGLCVRGTEACTLLLAALLLGSSSIAFHDAAELLGKAAARLQAAVEGLREAAGYGRGGR